MSYAPDEKVTYIVGHYSATPIEREYTYAQLERDHKARGFREGGYHFYFPRKGGRIAGRDLTQPGRFEMGAHSQGENDESIGLCFEGGVTLARPNFGFDTRTQAQKDAMAETISDLLVRFPRAVVKGHRDMPGAATQCPGHDFGAWWDGVLRDRLDHPHTQPNADWAPDPVEVSQGPWAGLFSAFFNMFRKEK